MEAILPTENKFSNILKFLVQLREFFQDKYLSDGEGVLNSETGSIVIKFMTVFGHHIYWYSVRGAQKFRSIGLIKQALEAIDKTELRMEYTPSVEDCLNSLFLKVDIYQEGGYYSSALELLRNIQVEYSEHISN